MLRFLLGTDNSISCYWCKELAETNGWRKSKLSVVCVFLNFILSPETMMTFEEKASLVVLLISLYICIVYIYIHICIVYILAAERLIVLSNFV